jgi:hypothetical protein
MEASQALYRLTWQMPGSPEHHVLGVHVAVSELQGVLVDAGATAVSVELLEAGQGRTDGGVR